MSDRTARWPKHYSAAVSALLAASLVVNLVQARHLHAALDRKSRQSVSKGAVGQLAETIHAKGLGGAEVTLDFTDRSLTTVLYYFAPNCIWCEKNAILISELAREAHTDYRFVALTSSEDVHGYLENHPMSMPVLTHVSKATVQGFGFSSTPLTVVVAPGGRITKRWRGAFNASIRADIEQFFSVKLPALP